MPVPETSDHAIANRRLLRDDVLDRLLAAIVDGTLEPGERLRDEQLATWLGVSRTPIREAITRLADMKLIEMEPNRFTRVAPIDLDRFRDAQLVAAELYQLAIHLSLPKLTDEDFTTIDETISRATAHASHVKGHETLDDIWDLILIFAIRSENDVLLTMVNELYPDVRRISAPTWSHISVDSLHRFFDDFRRAITAHDADNAGRMLKEATVLFAQQTAIAADLLWPEAIHTQPIVDGDTTGAGTKYF